MKHVVVVEDDPDLQVLTTMLLEAHGHHTSVYGTGREAVQGIVAQPPALVLLDWALPELNGLEVLRELRRQPATADVPIIMVTALDRPEIMAAAFDSGATDFVRKPFTSRSLLTAVASALSAESAARTVTPAQLERLSA